MARQWRWWWVGVAAAVPAAGFVFVPQRAGVEAAWSAPAPAAEARLWSDYEGNVYVAEPTRVTALSGRTGEAAWSLEAPDRSAFEGILDSGPGLPVLAARDRSRPGLLTLIGVVSPAGEPALTPERWRRGIVDAPPSAAHTVAWPMTPAMPEGEVYVAADGALQQLDASGEVRWQKRLGERVEGVVWADAGWAFCQVAEAGARRIIAVPLDRERAPRPLALPDDETVRGVRLVPESGALVVYGAKRLYVAPFDLTGASPAEVPCRAIAPAAASRVTADGLALVVIEEKTAASFALPVGTRQWKVERPAGVPAISVGGSLVTIGTDYLAGLGTDGREVWRHAVPGLLECRPVEPDWRSGRNSRSVVACRRNGGLAIYDPASGQLLAAKPLGGLTCEPLYIEDTLFAALAAGPGGEPALVGFDLSQPAQVADARYGWVWQPPAGSRIDSLQWLPDGRLLIARVGETMYAFE